MTRGVVDLLELRYQQLFLVFSPLTDEIISYYVMTAISALSTRKCLLRRFLLDNVMFSAAVWTGVSGEHKKGVLQTAKIVCRSYPEEKAEIVCQQNQSSFEKICWWNITKKKRRSWTLRQFLWYVLELFLDSFLSNRAWKE